MPVFFQSVSTAILEMNQKTHIVRLLDGMIPLLLIACVTSQALAESDAAQAFKRSNPGYRERAGKFYEKDYLPGAIKGLQAAFAPQQLDTGAAGNILTNLIYDFLDQYIAAGTGLTRRNHAAVIAKLDAEVHRLIDDPAIAKRYERWKADTDPAFPNPLSFLTMLERQSPPVALNLSPSLKKEGWHLQSLESLEETGQYADVLGMEPYQVFVIHHQKESGDRSRRAMTLLLYRQKHAPKLLAQLDRESSVRVINSPKQIKPQLFWQTKGHVVFVQENPQASQRRESLTLKRWIQRQWIGK